MNAGLGAAAHASRSEIVVTPGGFPVRVEEITRPARPEARTILMVNGALASSRSYRWAIEVLADLNLVLYDLPHAEPATSQNAGRLISSEAEIAILDFLIAGHAPNYIGSMSWGGSTALFALARNPPSVEKAVLCSFTDHVAGPLRMLLAQFVEMVEGRRYGDAAELVGQTLGARLPEKLKLANYAYLTSLGDGAREYILHHMQQMLSLDVDRFAADLAGVGAEVLFLNGAEDLYAPPADAEALARRLPRARSVAIADCGHFLALEGQAQAMQLARQLRAFLAVPPSVPAGQAAGAAMPPN